MMIQRTSRRCRFLSAACRLFSIPLFILHIVHSSPASAQITTDGAIGPAQTLTGPDYSITADLGRQAGNNLFHSFGVFNVNAGESATFTGPEAINNIIGRVTGGAGSWIDGPIRSEISGANLFLLNPAGIMFGPDAALDIGGSFHAGTADYLKLGSDGRFDATSPEQSTLTVSPPSGFGFVSESPASISLDNSSLGLTEGQTFSVIGGDIRIRNSVIQVPSGTVNLISVNGPGEALIDKSGIETDGISDFGAISIFRDMESENADINVSAEETGKGGSVFIRAGRFELENSVISANTNGEGRGGNMDIAASESVHLDGGKILSRTYSNGDAGDIHIRTAELDVVGGSQISASSWGDGNAGNIFIQADDSIYISCDGEYPGGIASSVNEGAGGQGGRINIQTPDLVLTDHARITVQTKSEGPGGTVVINVDTLSIHDGAAIESNAESAGKGGDIFISASASLLVSGLSDLEYSSRITASAEQAGDGGGITIIADELRLEAEGEITAFTEGGGHGGEINIEADRLIISGGSRITGSSWGNGNAGEIYINATTSVDIDCDGTYPCGIAAGVFEDGEHGGGIYLSTSNLSLTDHARITVETEGAGRGGAIEISADTVSIMGGAGVESHAAAGGSGGDIAVTAAESVIVSGLSDLDLHSRITVNTEKSGGGGSVSIISPEIRVEDDGRILARTEGSGDGGHIQVDADRLYVTGGGQISGSSFGSGDAGNIDIRAGEFVVFSGQGDERSTIYAKAYSDGDGGAISIETDDLIVEDGAKIESSTSGSGKGGRILIQADGSISLSNDGNILSESSGSGDAGEITLSGGDNIRLNDSAITTAAGEADGGNVQISVPNLMYLTDSRITATVGGGLGNGGNIEIDPAFVILKNSQIIANAYGGNGGNISITADQFLADPASIVSASSALGIDGTVNIDAPDTDVSGSITVLTSAFSNVETLLHDSCWVKFAEKQSSLVIVGRGGMALSPDGFQ